MLLYETQEVQTRARRSAIATRIWKAYRARLRIGHELRSCHPVAESRLFPFAPDEGPPARRAARAGSYLRTYLPSSAPARRRGHALRARLRVRPRGARARLRR